MVETNVLVFDEAAEWYCETLTEQCPGYVFHTAKNEEEALRFAGEAEILCALAPRISVDLVRAMPKLKWIQALSTGVDNLLSMPELSSDVIITNTRGMHGPQMSELAILLMMSLLRRFPAMLRNQQNATWERWQQPLLQDKTACIVGLGIIAETLATRCNAFGMRVTGVSDGRSEVEGFARIYKRTDLANAAADADFLVVLVPYAPETHHLVNAEILQAMKPSAYLINLARGGCIDEDALIEHLSKGTIAGAGLDVFNQEPLPQSSPLWSLPDVILTPHLGGFSDCYPKQAEPIVAANLQVYASGNKGALQNVIQRRD